MKRMSVGITLVEVIVTISIIVVLVAISALAIARARRSSLEAATLSNLRQHYAVFIAYTGDYADSWPLVIAPPINPPTLAESDGLVLKDDPYFSQHVTWPQYMANGYYNGSGLELFRSPGDRNRSVSYFYSCAFIAKAEYWSDAAGNPPRSAALWGATHHSEVTFPSSKALLLDYSAWEVGPEAAKGMPTVFADGRVDKLPASSLLPGDSRADGHWVGAMHFQDTFPGLHTLRGVRGRDRNDP